MCFLFLICSYSGIWLDSNDHPHRKWYWKVGNLAITFTRLFSLVTYIWGYFNNSSIIEDFNGWLNVTLGASLALYKTVFLVAYRMEITEAMERIALFDKRIQLKSDEDAEVRELRSAYIFRECLFSIS